LTSAASSVHVSDAYNKTETTCLIDACLGRQWQSWTMTVYWISTS